jgi:hypothetical protein
MLDGTMDLQSGPPILDLASHSLAGVLESGGLHSRATILMSRTKGFVAATIVTSSPEACNVCEINFGIPVPFTGWRCLIR